MIQTANTLKSTITLIERRKTSENHSTDVCRDVRAYKSTHALEKYEVFAIEDSCPSGLVVWVHVL